MGVISKYPGDQVVSRFTARNLGGAPVRLRAKIDINGYVSTEWTNLPELAGGASRSYSISRTVRSYTTVHRDEDATLRVETTAGVKIFEQKWNDLYDMLPRGSSVQVSGVLWDGHAVSTLASSYL